MSEIGTESSKIVNRTTMIMNDRSNQKSETVLLAVRAEEFIVDNRVLAICDHRLHNYE